MGASIHINGTKSSVVDTIFVCRTTGTVKASQFQATVPTLEFLLKTDLANLRAGDIAPTPGDARCLLLGHLTRLVVWQLRSTWQPEAKTHTKLSQVQMMFQSICLNSSIDRLVKDVFADFEAPVPMLLEVPTSYDTDDRLSF
jgi:hypothetical protein